MSSGKVIPPGGEQTIDVSFKTGHYNGPTTKTISVTTNDPNNPTLSLKVTANIVVDFALKPYTLYMGRFSRKEEAVRSASVIAKEIEKLQITKVESLNPLIEARVVKHEPPAEGDAPSGQSPEGQPGMAPPPPPTPSSPYSIEVKVKPGMKPGRFKETVTIHTNVASVPTYNLEVAGEIVGDIYAEPRVIAFQKTDDSQPQEKTIEVRTNGDAAFTVTKVECTEPLFTPELITIEAGKAYQVKVKLGEVTSENFVRGDLVITLDDPEQPELRIPTYVSFRKPRTKDDLAPRPNTMNQAQKPDAPAPK